MNGSPEKTLGRILVVGRDIPLLNSRKMILGTYFHVDAAGRVGEVRRFISECRFDLVILCSSLSDDECEQIARDVLEIGDPPAVICVGRPERPGTEIRTIPFPEDAGVLHLLKKTAEILGYRFRAKGLTPLIAGGQSELLPSAR